MTSVSNMVRSIAQLLPSGPAVPTNETDAEPSDAHQSSLSACPRCDSVYIAAEKRTCASCGTDVEQGPATLETK
jgi:Mg-chelatase subunit ChlI